MRRRVRGVGEERPAVGEAAADRLDQLVGEVGRRVEGRRQRHLAAVLPIGSRVRALLDDRGGVGEVAGAAGKQRERALEAQLVRALRSLESQVPLAGHVRVIAGAAQQRGDGDDPARQVALVAGASLLVVVGAPRHRAEARRVRVGSREQHRPRGRAGGGHEEAREQQPRARQRVEVRRADLAAQDAEICVAEVVRDDQQDVGALPAFSAAPAAAVTASSTSSAAVVVRRAESSMLRRG